ncbi:Hypothetical predicted protein [Cloeon dipterum]|uniref:Uncharacterized protein n=1 Tax=Cloeon dipterum TaxID=197152 RepID=A0A8S1BKZ1_9INSE|nr:Hypothetical predicted protein [Cloeon dipterum]
MRFLSLFAFVFMLVAHVNAGPIADKENNNQDSPREGVLEKEQHQKAGVKAVGLPESENGNKGESNEGALNEKQQQKEEDEAKVSLHTVKKEGEIVPSVNPGKEETKNSLSLADPEKKKEEPSAVVNDNEEKKSEPIPDAEEKKEMISPLADAVEQDTPLSQDTGEKETDPEDENEQTKVKEDTSINIITEAPLEEIQEGTPDKQDKEEAETNVSFWQSIGNFFSKRKMRAIKNKAWAVVTKHKTTGVGNLKK